MTRERRERLTEAFVGARDGALAAQLGGQKVWPGGLPDYAQPERGPKTGEDLYAEWGHLAQARTDN